MRITKQGIHPGQTIWKGVCSTCKSEAEATQSELQIQYPTRGLDIPFAKETCPVCNTPSSMIFHKSNHLSESTHNG